MSVSNGQLANATTFNNAFMSRQSDDNTTGIKSLESVNPLSGGFVTNIQRDINGLNSFTGRGSNGVYNTVPLWGITYVGSVGDSLKARVEAILAEFSGSTGHTHNGTDGDGTKISAANLLNINQYTAEYQYVEFAGATGSSTDVSSAFPSKTPGGSATSAGVITTGSDNRVNLLNTANGTQIEDAGGQRVYGRITESSGVWTLSYFTNEAGTETSHTLAASTNLGIFFREVFTLATRPTIPADVGSIGSLDLTADVVDASPTQRGVVSTGTQSFGGHKTFQGGASVRDDSAAFDVEVAMESTVALTANRKLIVDTKNTNIALSGNNSGDVTTAAFGSTPNSLGLTLAAQVLNLQPADATNPGSVSTVAQTFGGEKTFAAKLTGSSEFFGAQEADAATTGASQTLGTPTKILKAVTNASLTSLQGITAPSPEGTQFFILANKTGATVTLLNEAGAETAVNRILTGTAANLDVSSNASVWIAYDTVADRWRVIGGSGGSGFVDLTTAQTVAGAKTFTDFFRLTKDFATTEYDDSSTGTVAALATAGKTSIRMTGAAPVLHGMLDGSDGKIVILSNVTGADYLIKHQSLGASATRRIISSTGADFTHKNGSLVALKYDNTTLRWRMLGGSGGGSFVTSTLSGTTLTMSADGFQKFRYVAGAPQTWLTLDPALAVDGAIVVIFGTSDTNYYTVTDNDISGGWVLNGPWVAYRGKSLTMQWDATENRLFETART